MMARLGGSYECELWMPETIHQHLLTANPPSLTKPVKYLIIQKHKMVFHYKTVREYESADLKSSHLVVARHSKGHHRTP